MTVPRRGLTRWPRRRSLAPGGARPDATGRAIMLRKAADYARLAGEFRWPVPARYNIAVDVCDRHAGGGDRLALVHVEEDGTARHFGFDELKRLSNRFANVLQA